MGYRIVNTNAVNNELKITILWNTHELQVCSCATTYVVTVTTSLNNGGREVKVSKTERANARLQLTLILHVTEALISEKIYEEIDKTKLQELRVQFIDVHSAYGDALVNSDTDIDKIELLDNYVQQKMEHYYRLFRSS